MDYEKSYPFSGSGENALEVAARELVRAGFRISEQTTTFLSADCTKISVERSEALAWAKTLRIRSQEGALLLQAQFAGQQRMVRFYLMVFWIMPIMASIALVVPWLLAGWNQEVFFGTVCATVGVMILALLTLLTGSMFWKRRCQRALDRLLADMAAQEQPA